MVYDNEEMKVVNLYTDLGISFTTKISFSYACEDMVSRGKKVVVDIIAVDRKTGFPH